MEENEICETLSNALITVGFNEGYTKTPPAKCFQRRVVVVCLSRFMFYGGVWIFSRSVVKLHRVHCGFIKQLRAVCSYSLVSARLAVMNGKAAAVIKLKKNNNYLLWIFPITPQCAAADRLILRYESTGLLFLTGRSLKLDVLHECPAVKLKKDLRWC